MAYLPTDRTTYTIKKSKCQQKNYLDIYVELWYSPFIEGRGNMAIELEYIPQLFIDIGYIPADLLFDFQNYPRYIYVENRKWELNEESNVAFYEPPVPRQYKETK